MKLTPGVIVESLAELTEGAVVPLDAEVPLPLEVLGVGSVILVQVQQVLCQSICDNFTDLNIIFVPKS